MQRVVLTPYAYELARLYASGLPHPEIARRLARKPNTVASNLRHVRAKLGVRTAREIAMALQDCEVREWDHHGNVGALGLRRGDAVVITGGRFKGREGTYVRNSNSELARIAIGGGTFCITKKYIQPKEH